MAERRPLVMIGGSLRELPDGDSIAMTRVWQSGMTVIQGERVISPLDWEEYRRTGVTGGGSTDPADDLANYFAITYRRAAPFPAPTSRISVSGSFASTGATRVAPVISAGTRTLLVSATGRGSLTFLAGANMNGGTRTQRWEITVDGRVLLDASVSNDYAFASIFVGRTTMNSSGNEGTYAWEDYSPIEFRRSLSVHVTPTATTNASDFMAYRLRGLA